MAFIQVHKKRIVVVFLILFLGLLCQLAAYVSPGWNYIDGKNVLKVQKGVWYQIICRWYMQEECVTEIATEAVPNDMLEFQIETSCALAAIIASIVFCILHQKTETGPGITFLALTTFSSMASGILALTSAGVYGDMVLQRHNEALERSRESFYKFPYSLILCGAGGALACLVSIFLVVETHKLTTSTEFKKLLPKRMPVTQPVIIDKGYRTTGYQPQVVTIGTSNGNRVPAGTEFVTVANAAPPTQVTKNYVYQIPTSQTSRQYSNPQPIVGGAIPEARANTGSVILMHTGERPVSSGYGVVHAISGSGYTSVSYQPKRGSQTKEMKVSGRGKQYVQTDDRQSKTESHLGSL